MESRKAVESFPDPFWAKTTYELKRNMIARVFFISTYQVIERFWVLNSVFWGRKPGYVEWETEDGNYLL
jgi:hypothetical protein